MNTLNFFVLLIIILAISCKSPSEKVMDNFKEVDESLEKTNKTVDSLSRQMKFVGFDKAVADSLEKLFDNTSVYLKRLKSELDSSDSHGEKLGVAKDILIKTQKGDSLFNYLVQVYDVANKYGDSTSRQYLIDLRKYGKDKWLERYFRKVPTIAASTILSKFQNDLGLIKISVMSAGITELKNKILSE